MPPIQSKFPKYMHSPFSYSLDGVRAVVESNGKIAIHQNEDVIDTSVAFINKLNIMLKVERPFNLEVGDIKAELKHNGLIDIRQYDSADTEAFDLIRTTNIFISELSQMLRATRTIEWMDKPYRNDDNDIQA